MTNEGKLYGVIRFSNGTYHKGGEKSLNSGKTMYECKLYRSVKVAENVLIKLENHPWFKDSKLLDRAEVVPVKVTIKETEQ